MDAAYRWGRPVLSIRYIFFLFCALFFISRGVVTAHGGAGAPDFSIPRSVARGQEPFPSRQVENNVAVEFYVKALPDDAAGFEDALAEFKLPFGGSSDASLSSGSRAQDEVSVRAGQDVALIFRVTDATMNWPIQGQGFVPDSPIRHVRGRGDLQVTRRQLIKRAKFYGGHFPIDEYTYLYVLNTLDGTVSIMDTSGTYTGKPIGKIELTDGGGAKAIDIDIEWLGRFAYVTLESDEVAVVDCMRMCVASRVKVGSRPHHVYVQPDGRLAWVCNDGDSTVSIIDTGNQNVIKTITVGGGHHEMVFTDDSRYACITNSGVDSVTLVDVYSLEVMCEIRVGKNPHGLGYSSLSQFVYVANEGAGSVSVVDIWSKRVVGTIPVGKGVRTVKFGPDPRFGFAPNSLDNTCSMIDVTKDIVSKTIKTGVGPEDVTFSSEWVFIRNTGSADMTAMSMRNMIMLRDITIGHKSVGDVELPMGHVSVSPLGDGHSVLVPSPGDRAVFRYAPGEATAGGTVPSEIFNTQANGSSKLVVYYRGLQEVSSGVYLRVVRLQRPGRYEIGFYIDNPELAACFELNVVR